MAVDLLPRTYNPAQQTVVDLLGRGAAPTDFSASLGRELFAELETTLGPLAAQLPPNETLWVSKHALATVHGCEAHHVATAAQSFTWSVAAARGTVAHRAIELAVNWHGEPAPMTLVDE